MDAYPEYMKVRDKRAMARYLRAMDTWIFLGRPAWMPEPQVEWGAR